DAARGEAQAALDGKATGFEEHGATKAIRADGHRRDEIERGLDAIAVATATGGDDDFCRHERNRLAAATVAGGGKIDDLITDCVGGVGEFAIVALADGDCGA